MRNSISIYARKLIGPEGNPAHTAATISEAVALLGRLTCGLAAVCVGEFVGVDRDRECLGVGRVVSDDWYLGSADYPTRLTGPRGGKPRLLPS